MINVDNIDFTSFYNGARELCEMYKQELEAQKVNASGELSNSVDFDVDYDENSITLYFNMAMYWYYIEHGRKPNGGGGGQSWGGWQQATRDIQQWIENKMNRGLWVPKSNKPIPHAGSKEIKGVAYTIVRKIHTRGFYGNNSSGLHILEKVLRDAEVSGLIDKMVNSVVQGFDNEINVEFESL